VRGWWLDMIRYAMPHWRLLGAIGALMLLSVGLDALVPWPMKVLVDNVLQGDPLPEKLQWLGKLPGANSAVALVAWLAGATVLVYLLNQAAQTLRTYLETGVGVRMAMDLGADLFDRLQRLSLRFHGRQMTGDLIRRVTHDTGCVKQLVLGVALPLVHALASLGTLFLVMWHMDPPLAILAMMVAPPLGLLIRLFARPMAERTYEQQQMEGQMMALAEQTLSSLPVVQAFGREDHEEGRFRQMSFRTLQAYLRAVASQLQFKVGVGGVLAVGTAVIMGIGGIHVVKESLSVGGLLVFLTYLASLYGPMTTLAYLASGFAAAAGGARRVLEVMGQEDEILELPGSRPLPPVKGNGRKVCFEGVTVGYEKDRPVLREVSLEAGCGDTVAIVGATGAGKSTLVSLIPRLMDPWEGRVTLDGMDIRQVTLESLRSQVAIVLQDPFLLPLTVAENIAYGKAGASSTDIVEAAKAAGAHDFIQKLPQGYDTVLGEGGASLSGGEMQRISIARALLKDAPILILDEPTSSLDAATEASLVEALEVLMKGRTTFIIAHRLSTVRKANRIVVLEEGTVVETGTHQELLRKEGAYARFYQLQFGTAGWAQTAP
jgi:ATP-binding cassette subfamily B protein